MSVEDQIVFEADTADRVAEDTPWQFRRSDDPVALARQHSISNAFQIAEDQAFDVLMSTGLDTATGNALEQWGEFAGELRGGLVDSDYIRIIRGRVMARFSSGKITELHALVMAITEASAVRVVEVYPAGLVIEYDVQQGLSDLVISRIVPIIQAAIPAGVGHHIVQVVDPAFGFDGDPTALGFGDGGYATTIG